MKNYVFRLHRNQDLKNEILSFAIKNHIRAGVIITCLGCLNQANIRLADETKSKELKEKFEIISLSGTFSEDGGHFHIAIADAEGRVIGGHLLEGCKIYLTAEIVVGEIDDLSFSREYDEETGFKELKITNTIKKN